MDLIDCSLSLFKAVKDGKIFFIKTFPPFFGFSLSKLRFEKLTQFVIIFLKCLRFQIIQSFWVCWSEMKMRRTLFLRFYFRMIFSCFKGSLDLYTCEGSVNYSSSLKGLGAILMLSDVSG